MLIVVQFEDVYSDQPERLPERAKHIKHMEAHLAFMAKHSGHVVAAGPCGPRQTARQPEESGYSTSKVRPQPRRCTKATRSGWPGCASRCV